ncbi:putative lipoprotein [Pseudomonas savastanoi pv. glycinea]|nr:putative lipoprotein [Pseudomonas savastanoi pv. glycinea]
MLLFGPLYTNKQVHRGVVMRTPFEAFISLLMAVFILGGCTRVGLAYRNLDIIIPWSLGDYLEMNSAQKDWFDERLKEHLSWHCTTQLPGYLGWLDRLQRMVETNQVTADELQARTDEAKLAIGQISRQITPSAVELLAQLDDKQVQEMQNAFAKDQRKRENEYLKEPLPQQISDRAERMEKRLTPWMGKLNAGQLQRIQSWSQSLGEQNRAWLDNRANWQKRFVATVQDRKAPDFPSKIAKLLQDRETFWTPEYREAYDRTEQAAISLLVDLMAQSTPEQRQRLLSKIADTRKDFTDLSCLKAAQAS